jgi:hypothetical protein
MVSKQAEKPRRHIQAWSMEGIQANREQEYIAEGEHASEQGTL